MKKATALVLASALCATLFTGCGDGDKIEIDSRKDKDVKVNRSITYDIDKANEETPAPTATSQKDGKNKTKKDSKEEGSMFKFGVTEKEG